MLKMETSIPHLYPAQLNYPEDWQPVCLHSIFLDSELPEVLFLVSHWIKLNSILDLGFSVDWPVCFAGFIGTPPSESKEPADKRVAYMKHPLA